MFGKNSALNDILCFQRKFKCGPYSNSTRRLPIQPSEFIKKHAHKWPIPDAGHLHESMLQTQTTSQGSSHTRVTAGKACQTMCIINHSLFHMHGCANWCHETSSTSSMEHWLNAVCHCLCCSHTLTFISTTLWHAFLWIVSFHSSQITSKAAFTSAPFWRRISATSLCPECADVYKGVAPSWGFPHGQQMQKHKRGWSANKC